MAHEMGHGAGMDMAAMVPDIRNRFLVCLAFTTPLFFWAPMGLPMKIPAPPFGLTLDQWLFVLATVVLSVGTGYVFSVGSTFFFEGVQFYEAVSILLVFILLGHWLEMRARAGVRPAATCGKPCERVLTSYIPVTDVSCNRPTGVARVCPRARRWAPTSSVDRLPQAESGSALPPLRQVGSANAWRGGKG